MEYIVVLDDTSTGLTEQVREYISKGWAPIGGVAISNWFESWENDRKGYTETTTRSEYCQAMIRGK
jgi:hypothetical protein